MSVCLPASCSGRECCTESYGELFLMPWHPLHDTNPFFADQSTILASHYSFFYFFLPVLGARLVS